MSTNRNEAAELLYPPELLAHICAHVYSSGLPAFPTSLDPLITDSYGPPTALPSTLPAANWAEPVSRRTLSQLCLVNKAWYDAAKPWLWYRVEVRLPRTWLSIVEEIAWPLDEASTTVEGSVGGSIKASTTAAMSSSSSEGRVANTEAARKLEESIIDSLSAPDDSIPLELLSPILSRDSSPRRLRAKSPARWKIMRSISNAIQAAFDYREPGVYVPTPHDSRPGRFVRHLDFNHFRTIGMRRSVDEGMNSRFVTGERVEAVLKEMPNLVTFGATEYMDGALTLPVLKELFLRGAPSYGCRGRPSRGRDIAPVDPNDSEEEDTERRRECRDLEAVDLTGCVSAVFVSALTDLVNTYLIPPNNRNVEDKGRFPRDPDEPVCIPGLQRLGLRGVKSISPDILSPFVLAFPSLTHLDLSGTRATPELLHSLGQSNTIRLHSLALARCIRLTSESIRDFLVDSPVAHSLIELNLYGDLTFASPLLPDDVHSIMTQAPCFLHGNLAYLDLSSAAVRTSALVGCPRQPKLRSLGFSYIPDLPIKAITEFIKTKLQNIEVLTLVGTSPELDCGLRTPAPGAVRGSPRAASVALHSNIVRQLCTPPFSFSLSNPSSVSAKGPPTRLRVVELSMPLLTGLGAGAGSWRIVRSRGGRGWYVDTASGWVADVGDNDHSGAVLRRDLKQTHPLRVELEKLSVNGNVKSGTGWHARKMEILHGHGMLGREDGLYGAVSFAYQG